jgi:hypothetical protein
MTLAAIIMQFLFLLILRIAAGLLPSTYHLLRPLTLFSVMTLGLLLLSEGILGDFQIGSIAIAGIQISLALFVLFVVDTAFLTYLLIDTGGSRESPFTSLLLMVPVLAILLEQPVYPQVSSYVGLVVVALSMGMMWARQEEVLLSPEDSGYGDGRRDADVQRRQSWIYWGVSVASLILVMVVAWFPRISP